MKAQELRDAVLQLAIQGKLVQQEPNEEPANELLKKIKAEREQLVKDKKIKDEKPLPEILDYEKPFEIPNNWAWVRLGDIVHINPRNYINENLEASFIPMRLIGDGYTNTHTSEIALWKEIKSGFTHFKDGDIVIAKITPCFENRKSAILSNLKNGYGAGTTELHVLRTYSKLTLQTYILWIVKSQRFINEGVKTYTGTAGQQRIGKDFVANYVIPFPPLAEQQRIVAKIEEIMLKIDEYEKLEQELSALEENFPADFRKSILQYAVQGKLVPQNPSEEPSRVLVEKIKAEKEQLFKEKKIRCEKPLPKITDEEKTFEIPDGWEWIRFGDVLINRDGERIPLSLAQREKMEKNYDYYGASGIIDRVSDFIFSKRLLLIGEDGANLLVRSKPIAFFAEGKYWVNNHAHVLDCGENVNLDYIALYINSISLAQYVTGTAQPKMNQQKMNSIPIPLPPLVEQQRIVDKVNELMKLCDILADEKALSQYKPKPSESKIIPFPAVIEQEDKDLPQVVGFRSNDEKIDVNELKELQNVIDKYTKE